MTPAARIAAAAGLLDQILAGSPAEQALTTWGRKNRYAGSKDRVAIRDHVFDALRCQRSAAAAGGALTGRGLMIGHLRLSGQDPADFLTGDRHALPPLSASEAGAPEPWPDAVSNDLPDWIWNRLLQDLGDEAHATAQALRTRAPLFLRVNLAKGDLASARSALEGDGVETLAHPTVPTALTVTSGNRRVRQSLSYLEGYVEVQDAHSQAVVEALGDVSGLRILDYCAGGGGKSLALAAKGAQVFAHDGNPDRMKDLPDRAARAGTPVEALDKAEVQTAAPFDIVLTDVPCSGSGAWRRQPEAKWQITEAKLQKLTQLQADILKTCKPLVSPGGRLAYVTCSLLRTENEDQTENAFSAASWSEIGQNRWFPTSEGDGFYLGVYSKSC